MEWVYAILLMLVVLSGWALNVFSLPGNWLTVAAAAIYAWLGPPLESRLALGGGVVIGLVLLALAGEGVEFLASALGAQRAGASKRSAVLALVGSLIGTLVGMFVGLPIPVVGSIVAALLCAAFGASLGAILGELWKGRELEATWKIGAAAFFGRLLGTIGKIAFGSAMVGLTVAALALA